MNNHNSWKFWASLPSDLKPTIKETAEALSMTQVEYLRSAIYSMTLLITQVGSENVILKPTPNARLKSILIERGTLKAND